MTQNKRILALLTTPFDCGGVQTEMIEFGGEMAKRGHEFIVAGPPGNQIDQLRATGIRFLSLPDPVGWRGLLRYALRIRDLVRQERIDVVAPQAIRPTMAAGLARLFGVRCPIITTIHNVHDPSTAPNAKRVLEWICDSVTFESAYERRLVGLDTLRSGGPVAVVRCGLDLTKYAPRRKNVPADIDVPVIACVARLSSEKNHALLLRAWAKVQTTKKTGLLWIIGDGPLRNLVEYQIHKLGIGDSVRVMGECSNIGDLLQRVDGLVLTSSRESFPRSAREALACGVPVLLPRIGACPEITEGIDAGFLFEPNNEDELVTRLSDWVEHPERLSRLRQEARTKAKLRFGLDVWGRQFDRCLQDACGEV